MVPNRIRRDGCAVGVTGAVSVVVGVTGVMIGVAGALGATYAQAILTDAVGDQPRYPNDAKRRSAVERASSRESFITVKWPILRPGRGSPLS